MGNKLYVGNLDFETTDADLVQLFSGAGEVKSAHVIMDHQSGGSKGFAFVEMATDAEAQSAISLYNGHLLHERALIVNEARPREDRGGRPGSYNASRPGAGPRFREIKHKARGGRKARNY